MLVAGGSTDVKTYFALRLAADGTAATGLTITGFDLQYVRSGVAPSTKVDATALAATDSIHADNKAIEIDATDQPGIYRVDWPDAAFADGVREVILTVKVATAFTEHLRVEIDGEVNVVEWAGTDVVAGAIPAFAADAAGGLPVSDGGGLDLDAQLAATNEITAARMAVLTDWINGGRLDLILDIIATDTTTDIPALIATAQGDLDIITDSDGVILGDAGVAKVWDRVLTGATHNIVNSAGRRLRQIDAAFEVSSGTAQSGTASTITLEAGENPNDNIYRGDRIIIVGGTGVAEHGLCTAYNGTTLVATMSENWIITPDATSEYEVVPASVDVETVQHAIQTAGDLAASLASILDDTGTSGVVVSNMNTDVLDAAALATGAANEIADALLDRTSGVETGLTFRQWLRLAASALFNKSSGLETTTAVYRDFADTKARITATVDVDGNRSAVTTDAT